MPTYRLLTIIIDGLIQVKERLMDRKRFDWQIYIYIDM